MKTTIKKQYKQLENYLESVSSRQWNESYEESQKSKTICPFCFSKNVTQDIKRVQGKIDGNMSGSFGLFGGGMSGYVHGEIDTNEVYVCQDCKNVWKPEDSEYIGSKDVFYDLLRKFYFYIDGLGREVDFDEDNPEEKYKSQEEKQKAHDKEHEEEYLKEANVLRNFYPETIRWYIHNNQNYEYDFFNEVEFWDNETFNKYGFKMPAGWRNCKTNRDWGTIVTIIIMIVMIFGLVYATHLI